MFTMKWHYRFMELAKLISTWSKDTSTKTGAIIVGPDKEIRATGYNGFVRGVDDEVMERFERLEAETQQLREEVARLNAEKIPAVPAPATTGETVTSAVKSESRQETMTREEIDAYIERHNVAPASLVAYERLHVRIERLLQLCPS